MRWITLSIESGELHERPRWRSGGDQRVLWRIRVGVTQSHAADDGFLFAQPENRANGAMVVAPSGLRARVQTSPARGDHDVFQEHAVIQPGSGRQSPVDGKDHADRRIEELEVAPVLGFHLRGLSARDSQPAVEIPAYRPAPGEVSFEKLVRVILDLLRVRHFLGIEHRLYGFDQRIPRGSGQHVPTPRLACSLSSAAMSKMDFTVAAGTEVGRNRQFELREVIARSTATASRTGMSMIRLSLSVCR